MYRFNKKNISFIMIFMLIISLLQFDTQVKALESSQTSGNTIVWDQNMELVQKGNYSFAGIYEYDNLTINDGVEVTSKGISQLIIKVSGTLTIGKNVTIRVRNGYYPEAPSTTIASITKDSLDTVGTEGNGFRVYPGTHGKGGNGGDGALATYSYWGTEYYPSGGGGGGFGGGIGGKGGFDLDWYNGQDNGGSGGRGDGDEYAYGGLGGEANRLGYPGENTPYYGPYWHAAGGGGGNGGNGGVGNDYMRPLPSGAGGGGYGGGVLTIIADKIVYDNQNLPKFLVSGQKGGLAGRSSFGNPPLGKNGENGQGGMIVIECPQYSASLQHWNLDNTTYGTHVDYGLQHGIITGNPQKVFLNGYDVTDGNFPPTVPVGNGNGLQGKYYEYTSIQDAFNSSVPKQVRIDPEINFQWGTNKPDDIIRNDHFIVKWSGQVEAQSTNQYTFYTKSDDGVRLFIRPVDPAGEDAVLTADTKVIDNWDSPSKNILQHSNKLPLIAGHRYYINLEYYEDEGDANVQLLWSYGDHEPTVIPKSQLYADTDGFDKISNVSISYPLKNPLWPFSVDSNLPGIPSDDVEQYKRELMTWGEKFGYNIDYKMANEMISYETPFYFQDNNNINMIGTEKNFPLWKWMRDQIYIQTLKNSVINLEQDYMLRSKSNTNKNYIDFKYTYSRANAIYNEYVKFHNGKIEPLLRVKLADINSKGLDVFEGLCTDMTIDSIGTSIQEGKFADVSGGGLVGSIALSYISDVIKENNTAEAMTEAYIFKQIGNNVLSIITKGAKLSLLLGTVLDSYNLMKDEASYVEESQHFYVNYHFLTHYPDSYEKLFDINELGIAKSENLEILRSDLKNEDLIGEVLCETVDPNYFLLQYDPENPKFNLNMFELESNQMEKVDAIVNLFARAKAIDKDLMQKSTVEYAMGNYNHIHTLKEIDLNKKVVTMVQDQVLQLEASVIPSDAINKNVQWSIVSGSEVASVTDNGFIIAKSIGTATVRATSVADKTKFAECTVLVTKDKYHIFTKHQAKCPVKMEIYNDENEVVASITDEGPQTQIFDFGYLYLSEENGDKVKTAYLFDDNYKARILGTGIGSMDYSITGFKGEGEIAVVHTYNDVPITNTTVINIGQDNQLNIDENADGIFDMNLAPVTEKYDNEAPIITINHYNTSPTNKEIVVTASTNEGLLNETSHTFTENGSFEFVSTDAAGNMSKKKVEITNIDKTPPEISSTIKDKYFVGDTLKVSFDTSDTIFGIASKYAMFSGTKYEFDADIKLDKAGNYTLELIAEDKAGNVQKTPINITVSEKTLPTTPSFSYFNMIGNPVTLNGATDSVLDSAENLYITDYNNNRVSVYDAVGKFIRAYGIQGSGVGEFYKPSGIAIDAEDYLYVADTYNNRIVRFKDKNSSGTIEEEEWQAWGGAAGSGTLQFNKPMGVYVKGTKVYVADTYNYRVAMFDASDANNTWKAFGVKGSATAQFNLPNDIAIDSQDNIIVSDTFNNRVQKLDKDGAYIEKYASSYPYGLSVDSSDNIFVAERMSGYIKCVNKSLTYGGKGSTAGLFTSPLGVNIDATGRLWIVDVTANKVQYAKLTQ